MSANGKKIVIEGGVSLKGRVNISGSKNAVLPLLAATLITEKKCVIRNVPDMSDITTMISMLDALGKKVRQSGDIVTVESGSAIFDEAPYDLVKKMRASVLVMGAIAGRKKKIRIPLPGGCAIGTRPIDLHLKGMKKLGAKMSVSGGFVNLSSKSLKGDYINLDYPSVGATENLIMAACHAKGKTVIENVAREPEIFQLIDFLRAMGAEIELENNMIHIGGMRNREYGPVDFTVMDDRIQAGTYLVAGCIKNSKIEMDFSHIEVLDAIVEKLTETGAGIEIHDRTVKISAPSHLKSCELRTSPYPGFPTDLQAPFMALLSSAKGVSLITEDIFENRFLHCDELSRMGADIEIKGNLAVINGKKHLSGAPVTAMDLRGGAALVIAGLLAKGRTEISGIEHIERGYEDIVGNLKKLGAKIWIE